MDLEMVNLELNAIENRVLARVLRLRMQALSIQPASPERDEEMHVIVSICKKAQEQSMKVVMLGESSLN